MDNCPNCGVSLIGDPIPEKYLQYYGDLKNYKREIAIYDIYKDRTVSYTCPDCKFGWKRDE